MRSTSFAKENGRSIKPAAASFVTRHSSWRLAPPVACTAIPLVKAKLQLASAAESAVSGTSPSAQRHVLIMPVEFSREVRRRRFRLRTGYHLVRPQFI